MSVTSTQRSLDAVVIGGDIDGLLAATTLAKGGRRVALVEEADSLGGALREIEFAPGYRAAPLAPATDSTIIALSDGTPLVLSESVESTTESLKRYSKKDADHWPAFARKIQTSASFLAELYHALPPRIDADTLGEFLTLANLARKFRKLGRRGMVDLLRILPMPIADLLDDEFETPALKGPLAAFAVRDLAQGPTAAGTAFTFLHHHVARTAVTNDAPAAQIHSHEARASAAGVMIELNTKVRSLRVHDGRMTGVILESGNEIACRTVISSLDPYRSLLDLIDPRHHDPEFIHAVRNIRYRGVTTKILVALDALPTVPNLPTSHVGTAAGAVAGSLFITPTIRHVERAHEATKYGRCSDEPFIEIYFATLTQPGLAPAGRHVAILHVQYTPYRVRDGTWDILRDSLADSAIAHVDRHLPGFAARVRERTVLTPPDLESRFGVREGAVSQGEMALDQILFMRPVPAASRYATPIDGYYLCGAGTHPGAGVHGISGRLAARAALARGRRARPARLHRTDLRARAARDVSQTDPMPR